MKNKATFYWILGSSASASAVRLPYILLLKHSENVIFAFEDKAVDGVYTSKNRWSTWIFVYLKSASLFSLHLKGGDKWALREPCASPGEEGWDSAPHPGALQDVVTSKLPQGWGLFFLALVCHSAVGPNAYLRLWGRIFFSISTLSFV